jgi:hypothetical protein
MTWRLWLGGTPESYDVFTQPNTRYFVLTSANKMFFGSADPALPAALTYAS